MSFWFISRLFLKTTNGNDEIVPARCSQVDNTLYDFQSNISKLEIVFVLIDTSIRQNCKLYLSKCII